jgi:hypothetical protein
VAIYTGAKALSRWPINDESTLTQMGTSEDKMQRKIHTNTRLRTETFLTLNSIVHETSAVFSDT